MSNSIAIIPNLSCIMKGIRISIPILNPMKFSSLGPTDGVLLEQSSMLIIENSKIDFMLVFRSTIRIQILKLANVLFNALDIIIQRRCTFGSPTNERIPAFRNLMIERMHQRTVGLQRPNIKTRSMATEIVQLIIIKSENF